MDESGDTRQVHIHKVSPMSKAATEYFLPCDAMPEDVKSSLHPWLQELVGNSAKEVRSVLDRRWASISHESLVALRDRLLEFEPRSIIVHDGSAWLLTERALPEGYPPDYPRDIILIPPPASQEIVDEGLARFDFADTPVLRSFVGDFGGLRESIPDYADDFRIPGKWETLYDYWGEDDVGYGDWYSEWSESLVIYGSSASDMVLIHPDGRIAWIRLAGHDAPVQIAEDFSGFLFHFAEYRKQPWALDPVGPPPPEAYR